MLANQLFITILQNVHFLKSSAGELLFYESQQNIQMYECIGGNREICKKCRSNGGSFSYQDAWRALARAFAEPKNNQARQRPGWEGAKGESAQAACTDVISTISSDAAQVGVIRTVFSDTVGAYAVSTVCSDAAQLGVVRTVFSDTVGTYAVSTVSSDATHVGVIRTVFSDTVSTNAVSAISRHTVGADTIGAVSSDATQAGVVRTVFGNDRRIQVLAGIDSGQCECAACQYGEGQAKDQ
jgi:nucleoside diphosphate kinase